MLMARVPAPLQALSLGKPGSECCAVPNAAHWTFAELEAQASMPLCCTCIPLLYNLRLLLQTNRPWQPAQACKLDRAAELCHL